MMTAFEEYVDQYGMHFSKKLYEYAVDQMRDRNGNKLPPMTKEQVNEWFKAQGLTINNDKGWDKPYVLMMAKADYMGSSIVDDTHLAKFVKDYLDDVDGYPTRAFDEFVVKCRAQGEPLFWEDFL